MDRRKESDHKKTRRTMPSFKAKICNGEMSPMSNQEYIKQYLKIREQRIEKYYSPKTFNTMRNKTIPIPQVKTEKVDCLDQDMKLDEVLTTKNKKPAMQNHSAIIDISKSNDRLVIDLKDYLTLTKTKNIAKFKLKPISEQPDKLSSIDDIIKTANTVKFNQILNYGQSCEASQRTFLLVPQDEADSVNNEPKVCKEQVNGKKTRVVLPSESSTPVKTTKKIEQMNDKKSSSQLTNAQKGPKIIHINRLGHDTKYSIPKANLPEKESHPVIRVSKKKVKCNKRQSSTDNSVKPIVKGKKKVILRSHPFFSKHKPFVIKHTPAVTKVTKLQNQPVTNQQEDLLKTEIKLESVFTNNELIDEIKLEVPEELNFVMSQDSESINQIFPVALKSNDSDDYEYLEFVTNDDDNITEISTETDMQILGI